MMTAWGRAGACSAIAVPTAARSDVSRPVRAVGVRLGESCQAMLWRRCRGRVGDVRGERGGDCLAGRLLRSAAPALQPPGLTLPVSPAA